MRHPRSLRSQPIAESSGRSQHPAVPLPRRCLDLSAPPELRASPPVQSAHTQQRPRHRHEIHPRRRPPRTDSALPLLALPVPLAPRLAQSWRPHPHLAVSVAHQRATPAECPSHHAAHQPQSQRCNAPPAPPAQPAPLAPARLPTPAVPAASFPLGDAAAPPASGHDKHSAQRYQQPWRHDRLPPRQQRSPRAGSPGRVA